MVVFRRRKRSEINLLPESQRAEPLWDYLITAAGIVGLALILSLVVFGFNTWQVKQIKSWQQRLDHLQTEGQKEIQKTAVLVAKTKLVLDQYRQFSQSYPNLAEKLTVLESKVPNQVWLNAFTINNRHEANLYGEAPNPILIAELVKALKADSEHIQQVAVTAVTKTGDRYTFSVNLGFK